MNKFIGDVHKTKKNKNNGVFNGHERTHFVVFRNFIQIEIFHRELSFLVNFDDGSRHQFTIDRQFEVFGKLKQMHGHDDSRANACKKRKKNSTKKKTHFWRFNGGRHQNNFNIWWICTQQHSNNDEQKIHIFVTFMDFVKNDVRVIRHRFRFDQFLQQQTGGTEQNARIFGGVLFVQCNLVADQLSQLPHPLTTYAFGNTSSGQSARLRHNDVAPFLSHTTIVQNHLWQLQTKWQKNHILVEFIFNRNHVR